MGLMDDIMECLEFEGKLVGNGKMADRDVDAQAIEALEKEQLETMHMEMNKLKNQIADTFEKKEELLDLIETQAKLRMLIQKRLKGVKKIPQEYIDKYNAVVTEIRDVVKEQMKKET